ncbi:MAG: hypothetical protein BJ554DRAFT_2490, partial [Olpidium bornovanus]
EEEELLGETYYTRSSWRTYVPHELHTPGQHLHFGQTHCETRTCVDGIPPLRPLQRALWRRWARARPTSAIFTLKSAGGACSMRAAPRGTHPPLADGTDGGWFFRSPSDRRSCFLFAGRQKNWAAATCRPTTMPSNSNLLVTAAQLEGTIATYLRQPEGRLGEISAKQEKIQRPVRRPREVPKGKALESMAERVRRGAAEEAEGVKGVTRSLEDLAEEIAVPLVLIGRNLERPTEASPLLTQRATEASRQIEKDGQKVSDVAETPFEGMGSSCQGYTQGDIRKDIRICISTYVPALLPSPCALACRRLHPVIDKILVIKRSGGWRHGCRDREFERDRRAHDDRAE